MWRCTKGIGILKLHDSRCINGAYGTWRVCSQCGRTEIQIRSGRTYHWKVIDYGRD